jgi:phosphoglycolate phosphatase-like HAD superfamily hydrolase
MDIAAARAAGCPVIAVSYGYGKDHSNADAQADGCVDQLTDLVSMYLGSPACQPRLKLCTTGAT